MAVNPYLSSSFPHWAKLPSLGMWKRCTRPEVWASLTKFVTCANNSGNLDSLRVPHGSYLCPPVLQWDNSKHNLSPNACTFVVSSRATEPILHPKYCSRHINVIHSVWESAMRVHLSNHSPGVNAVPNVLVGACLPRPFSWSYTNLWLTGGSGQPKIQNIVLIPPREEVMDWAAHRLV